MVDAKHRAMLRAREYRKRPGVREHHAAWRRARRRSSPHWKLGDHIRLRVYRLSGVPLGQLGVSVTALLGCTLLEACAHLERQFVAGMSWRNWGFGHDKWHVDHKVPLCEFDHSDIAQLKVAWHYSNLQPLWQFDNLSKGDTYHGGTEDGGRLPEDHGDGAHDAAFGSGTVFGDADGQGEEHGEHDGVTHEHASDIIGIPF